MTYRRVDVLTDGGIWLALWVPEDVGRGDRWAQCRSLDFEREVRVMPAAIAAVAWRDEYREEESPTEHGQDARRRDNDLRFAYSIGYEHAVLGKMPDPEQAVRSLTT